MLSVVVCVGSSCYVRGSEAVAETMERLIQTTGAAAVVEMTGAFCMDRCSVGVSIRVGERTFAGITPDQVEAFFRREVLPLTAVPAC